MSKKQILRTLGASILIGLTITCFSIFHTTDVANNIEELKNLRFGFPFGFIANDRYENAGGYQFPLTENVTLDFLDTKVDMLWLPFIGSVLVNSGIIFTILFLIYRYIPASRKVYKFVNFWYVLLFEIIALFTLSALGFNLFRY